MKTPRWLQLALRDTYAPRHGPGLRKLNQVAARIDARTETVASALTTISEHLRS